MQINFDARLAASTVLVDGREWCQGTLTNLALNPGFETPGSTVEVRRNLCPNPVPRVDTSGWSAVRGTIARDTGSQVGETHRWVFTATEVGSIPSVMVFNIPATHPSASLRVTVEKDMWGSTPIYLAVDQAGILGSVTSTDARPALQVTIPNLGALVQVRIGIPLSAGLTSIGFTRVLVEYTTQVRPYFDGSYSPDPDLTPSWVGSANNSASVLSAPAPAGFVQQSGRYCIQSGAWSHSGTKSLRITRTGTAEQAAAGAVVWTPTSGDVGKTFTAAVWCRPQDGYDGSQDVVLGDRASRGMYVFLNAGVYRIQAEPVGEAQLLRMTFTIQAGQTLRVGGGGTMGQTIRYDDFTIVEGEHPDLMPFHGSTVNPEWPGVTYAWTGTPNASTSTRTTPAIDRIEVDRDPGAGWVPVRGGRRDVINGFVALTDHEMPLHQEVRYRVAGYSGDTYVGAFTGTVDTSIPGWCGVFVKIPANPNATVMVDPTNSIDIDSSTQGGSYDIAAGSSIAVAAWSGVNASRFTLNAITKTDVDSAQMRALLQKNRVVLLQGPDWAPFPPGWYYVESVSEGLRGDGAIKQGRKWSLSLVSTGVPSGDTAGVAGASWNQIRAKYATWDELKTANSTWFDVLQGGN